MITKSKEDSSLQWLKMRTDNADNIQLKCIAIKSGLPIMETITKPAVIEDILFSPCHKIMH